MDEWDVLRAQELVEDMEDARVVGMTLAFKTRLKSSLPSAPTKPSLRVPWNCRGQVLGGEGWGKISGASDTYSHPLQPSVFVCVCETERERDSVCDSRANITGWHPMPPSPAHSGQPAHVWLGVCRARGQSLSQASASRSRLRS